jgi:glycosyltransferase involved in cell wall biosynthesis
MCHVQDPFDLADKMEKILNLPDEERHRMGRYGRSLVIKKFNIKKVIGEYMDTLNRDLID